MKRKRGGAVAGAQKSKVPQWEVSPPETIAKWLRGKTAADLEAIEQDGRALYPEHIQRRDPKTGELQETPVCLRVPTSLEIARSRIKALDWAKNEARLNERPTVERAEAQFGVNTFGEVDSLYLLASCLFDADPLDGSSVRPHYMLPEELAKLHPRASLHALTEKLMFYQGIEDPRVSELSESDFIQTVGAIAKAGNLSPLVVIDGDAHLGFLLSTVVRLHKFLTPQP